jgi:hypothetical protein
MAGWPSLVRKREEGRGKREEGRGKREEGRGKREEGRGKSDCSDPSRYRVSSLYCGADLP